MLLSTAYRYDEAPPEPDESGTTTQLVKAALPPVPFGNVSPVLNGWPASPYFVA